MILALEFGLCARCAMRRDSEAKETPGNRRMAFDPSTSHIYRNLSGAHDARRITGRLYMHVLFSTRSQYKRPRILYLRTLFLRSSSDGEIRSTCHQGMKFGSSFECSPSVAETRRWHGGRVLLPHNNGRNDNSLSTQQQIRRRVFTQ